MVHPPIGQGWAEISYNRLEPAFHYFFLYPLLVMYKSYLQEKKGEASNLQSTNNNFFFFSLFVLKLRVEYDKNSMTCRKVICVMKGNHQILIWKQWVEWTNILERNLLFRSDMLASDNNKN